MAVSGVSLGSFASRTHPNSSMNVEFVSSKKFTNPGSHAVITTFVPSQPYVALFCGAGGEQLGPVEVVGRIEVVLVLVPAKPAQYNDAPCEPDATETESVPS